MSDKSKYCQFIFFINHLKWEHYGRMNVNGDEGSLKITIRVSPEELEMIEEYMADHGIENRSTFIREAVKGYIEFQTVESGDGSQNGLYVHLNDVHMATLRHLVDLGVSVDEEDFVRQTLLERIVPKSAVDEAIENAFRLAQQQTALK